MMYPSRDTLSEICLEYPVMDNRKDRMASLTYTHGSPRRSQPVDDTQFSPSQLQYLESMYPPVVLGPSATESEMRYYFGQQAVLDTIRRRTRGLNPQRVYAHPNDIPEPT